MNQSPGQTPAAIDAMIAALSGPEPQFDQVLEDFLQESHAGLQERCRRGSLLEFRNLGQSVPWLFRLTFRTRGLVSTGSGEVLPFDYHVIAIRFLPDYLRRADRFEMLHLIEPQLPRPFHPNLSAHGQICIEVYPGETLAELAYSLHDLLRWRLRQYDERDALNPSACAWGRDHVQRPIDDRPLFGPRLDIHLETPEAPD